jgi:hypothetical protein
MLHGGKLGQKTGPYTAFVGLNRMATAGIAKVFDLASRNTKRFFAKWRRAIMGKRQRTQKVNDLSFRQMSMLALYDLLPNAGGGAERARPVNHLGFPAMRKTRNAARGRAQAASAPQGDDAELLDGLASGE